MIVRAAVALMVLGLCPGPLRSQPAQLDPGDGGSGPSQPSPPCPEDSDCLPRGASHLSGENVQAVASGEFTIRVTLTHWDEGIPLKGRDIQFSFEGAERMAVTDEKGAARASFKAPEKGPPSGDRLVYQAIFKGDESFHGSGVTAVVELSSATIAQQPPEKDPEKPKGQQAGDGFWPGGAGGGGGQPGGGGGGADPGGGGGGGGGKGLGGGGRGGGAEGGMASSPNQSDSTPLKGSAGPLAGMNTPGPTEGPARGGVAYVPSVAGRSRPGTLDSGGPGLSGGGPDLKRGKDSGKQPGADPLPGSFFEQAKTWARGLKGGSWWDETPFRKSPPGTAPPGRPKELPLEPEPGMEEAAPSPPAERAPAPQAAPRAALPPATSEPHIHLRQAADPERPDKPDFLRLVLKIVATAAAVYLVFYSNLPYLLGLSRKNE